MLPNGVWPSFHLLSPLFVAKPQASSPLVAFLPKVPYQPTSRSFEKWYTFFLPPFPPYKNTTLHSCLPTCGSLAGIFSWKILPMPKVKYPASLKAPGSVVQLAPVSFRRNHWSLSMVQDRDVSGHREVSKEVREGIHSATAT